MCVQDYLTWVSIKLNFKVKVEIEQARADTERIKKLGIVEQDKQHTAEAEHYLSKVDSIAEALEANIERVTQQDILIRERVYAQALQRDHHEAKERKKKRAGHTDAHMIQYIQGVDLRANLAKLLTISKVLEAVSEEIKGLKDSGLESRPNK